MVQIHDRGFFECLDIIVDLNQTVLMLCIGAHDDVIDALLS
jgi:hypothetical protein